MKIISQSILILMIIFIAGCKSGPQSLTAEQEAGVKSTLELWCQVFNEDQRDSYGLPHADVVDFLGERTTSTDIMSSWYLEQNGLYNVDFYFDPEDYSVDSIGENYVKVILSYHAKNTGTENLTEKDELSLYLRLKEPYLVFRVIGDPHGLGELVESEGKELQAKDGFYNAKGYINWEGLEHIQENVTGDFEDFAFATQYKNTSLLYVVNDDYNRLDWDYEKWKPSGEMGIADWEGNILLPLEYDLVYSFGTLAEGYAEVEKNGKFGLVDLKGNIFIKPEYDAIYPGIASGSVVFVRKGKQFGNVDASGNVSMNAAAPDIDQVIANFDFSKLGTEKANEFEGVELLPMGKEDGHGYVSYAFPPYFLQELGLAPRVMAVMTHDPGDNQALSVEADLDLANGLKGIVSVLETWTFEPRYEYNDRVYKISTYDRPLKFISQLEIARTGGDITTGHYCEEEALKVWGDTIELMYTEIDEGNNPGEYTVYKYFKIRNDGSIKELTTNREFPFTEFAWMDESYMSCCYVYKIDPSKWDKERQKNSEMFYGEFTVYDTYDSDFVGRMIADIKADYSSGENMSPQDAHNLSFLQSHLKRIQNGEIDTSGKHEFEAW